MAEDVYSPFKVFAHMDKIEQLKRGKIITPVFIQVDLTNRCNLNCNFCFYKIHKLSAFDPKAEIPFETMKRMLREWKDIGVKALEISGGGEPLLHPNFKDIVKYAKKLGFEMALVTNGTLLDDETLELIKDFEWVRFSVDAVTPQTFKKIKGVDLFDKVIENLRKLIEIKSENNVIGYSFVVCRDNYTEIHEAAKFAKLLGCDNIRFSLAMTPLKEKLFEGIWDECVYLMERAKREEDENFKVFQFSNRIYDLAGEVYSECCYYTDFVGVVAPSGYFPCCRLKCDANFRFGSIDEPFKKVWFGEKRLRFLKMVRRGCPYDCWMTQKNKIIAALVNPPKKHVNFI